MAMIGKSYCKIDPTLFGNTIDPWDLKSHICMYINWIEKYGFTENDVILGSGRIA